jgi:hypothetical protein
LRTKAIARWIAERIQAREICGASLIDCYIPGPITGAVDLIPNWQPRRVMPPNSSDDADYRFLTAAGATVWVRLGADKHGRHELQIFGNRAGLLSLANVLLWLVANSWRREFLTLAELPFVRIELPLAVNVRMTATEPTGRDGLVCRTDRGEQFEWTISEDDLLRVALVVNRLVSDPGHEFDRLLLGEGSAAEIHVRMTDVARWLANAGGEGAI